MSYGSFQSCMVPSTIYMLYCSKHIVSELDSACLSWMSCLFLPPFNHSIWSKGTMHTKLYRNPSIGSKLVLQFKGFLCSRHTNFKFLCCMVQYIVFISNHYILSSWFSAIWVIGSYSYTLPANFHNFMIMLSLEWSCLILPPMVWQLPEQYICIVFIKYSRPDQHF